MESNRFLMVAVDSSAASKPLPGVTIFSAIAFRAARSIYCRLVFFRGQASSASTPGKRLPSIHSRNAPPAVETKVKSHPTPAALRAATVSPPPATATNLPALASAAAWRAAPRLPPPHPRTHPPPPPPLPLLPPPL